MVGDYISREAAIKAVCDSSAHTCNLKNCFHGCQEAQAILAIPAADVVEVRHGWWINGRCSECGEHAPFWAMATTYHLSKYCHGCGAIMDGGQEPPKEEASNV